MKASEKETLSACVMKRKAPTIADLHTVMTKEEKEALIGLSATELVR